MTVVCNDPAHNIMAKHMAIPTVLVLSGLLPATAIFVPLGIGLYKIATYKHDDAR